MQDFLRAVRILWYIGMSAVFIFGCMASVFVLLGMCGTDSGQPIIGLFTLVVFWWATATYRRKGLALLDEIHGKKSDTKENESDNDDGDDSL
jgi:hypothetical protein